MRSSLTQLQAILEQIQNSDHVLVVLEKLRARLQRDGGIRSMASEPSVWAFKIEQNDPSNQTKRRFSFKSEIHQYSSTFGSKGGGEANYLKGVRNAVVVLFKKIITEHIKTTSIGGKIVIDDKPDAFQGANRERNLVYFDVDFILDKEEKAPKPKKGSHPDQGELF